MSKRNKKINHQRGQILSLLIVALSVILVGVLTTVAGSQLFFETSKYSISSEAALNLAEAGVDKAVASINKTGGNYTGEQETFLGDGSYAVTITTKGAATKIITSTGYIPNKSNPRAKRTIKIQTSLGVGVAFVYGVQVGEGGLQLGNSNIIEGSVYSNGNISAGNNNTVKGDAWVGGGPQPSADQQTDCDGVNCEDFIFGKSVSGDTRLDIAQSFKPSMTNTLNKVSIKIKKFGNPTDVSVRILGDSGGKPDKNNVLTSGTLYSSLVTSSYGWIDVTFNSSPQLTQNTSYWLLIDTSSDAANYWSWQNDLAQSYTNGSPKWSPNWSTGSPNWNSFSGDLSFKLFMGGVPTSIRASNNLTVQGDVHANTIDTVTIGRDAYFQTITNSTVAGIQHPGSSDPTPKVFPISDANVTEWKQQAVNNGTSTGDITNCVATLNSKKYVGNVNFGSNCTITVASPIWITGDLTMGSNIILKLAPSYNSTSGVIVVDGKITLNSNNHLDGTGVGTSLLMALSTYDSRVSGIAAIVFNSNGNTGVFYASKGIIEPGTNNKFKELTAWGIRIINNSTINYETGLSSTLFSSGPTGSYSLVKGTYQVE